MVERESYFDLSGYRNSLTQSEFDNLLSKLRFDDTLQYIAIPKISIEALALGPNSKTARNGGIGGRPPRVDGEGRRDFLHVFDKLRKMGVKTILKVIVDDSAAPSHSDAAIEEALKNLGAEIWDWHRPDLCTEVIYNVAPTVREVHLHWSGNNAVLRGWSDEGGLKRLQELKVVYLYVQQVRSAQFVNPAKAMRRCDLREQRCVMMRTVTSQADNGNPGSGDQCTYATVPQRVPGPHEAALSWCRHPAAGWTRRQAASQHRCIASQHQQ